MSVVEAAKRTDYCEIIFLNRMSLVLADASLDAGYPADSENGQMLLQYFPAYFTQGPIDSISLKRNVMLIMSDGHLGEFTVPIWKQYDEWLRRY